MFASCDTILIIEKKKLRKKTVVLRAFINITKIPKYNLPIYSCNRNSFCQREMILPKRHLPNFHRVAEQASTEVYNPLTRQSISRRLKQH